MREVTDVDIAVNELDVVLATLRRIRGVHAKKRSNTDSLYHALSHAVHDVTKASQLISGAAEPVAVKSSDWRNGKVGIDVDSSLGFGPYPAQISRASWNGWVVPRFTREVAERIAHDSVELNREEFESYSWSTTGELYLYSPTGDVSRYSPDEYGMYHVGASEWTWMEVTDRD